MTQKILGVMLVLMVALLTAAAPVHAAVPNQEREIDEPISVCPTGTVDKGFREELFWMGERIFPIELIDDDYRGVRVTVALPGAIYVEAWAAVCTAISKVQELVDMAKDCVANFNGDPVDLLVCLVKGVLRATGVQEVRGTGDWGA